MTIAAKCPSCGASLSETSVLAIAPVCEHCHTVITKAGGTFGLTSAYGVNDPTITCKRVEADLAVLCEYKERYVGMMEACKQQLNWGVERYANLPNLPEYLAVQPVPSFGGCLGWGLLRASFWGGLPALVVTSIAILFSGMTSERLGWLYFEIAWYGGVIWFTLQPHYKAKAANGASPLENSRRRKVYEEAYFAAMKAAEPVKAAQDHRLRCQIRELEGLIETVGDKADDVRRILATL
ncbi:MAG: hypothetical protein WCI73_14275 [Phycisphaerae bacterium]